MYECDRWYEYKGNDEFENPPMYRKISKDTGYFVVALYPFETIYSPDVSLFGPFKSEKTCDDFITEVINN